MAGNTTRSAQQKKHIYQLYFNWLGWDKLWKIKQISTNLAEQEFRRLSKSKEINYQLLLTADNNKRLTFNLCLGFLKCTYMAGNPVRSPSFTDEIYLPQRLKSTIHSKVKVLHCQWETIEKHLQMK